MRRIAATLALIALTIVPAAVACDDDATARPTATLRAASRTPAGTSVATTPRAASTPAGDVEVTGIVGSVNTATRTIEISRVSGASVARVVVDGRTQIRRAGGGRVELREVRPSDRIIATGQLDDRGDALLADVVEVQQVVPGGPPGG